MELGFSFRVPYRELLLTSQFPEGRQRVCIADAQGSPTVWVNACWGQHSKHSKAVFSFLDSLGFTQNLADFFQCGCFGLVKPCIIDWTSQYTMVFHPAKEKVLRSVWRKAPQNTPWLVFVYVGAVRSESEVRCWAHHSSKLWAHSPQECTPSVRPRKKACYWAVWQTYFKIFHIFPKNMSYFLKNRIVTDDG